MVDIIGGLGSLWNSGVKTISSIGSQVVRTAAPIVTQSPASVIARTVQPVIQPAMRAITPVIRSVAPTIQRTITQSPIQVIGRTVAPTIRPAIQPAMRAITPVIRSVAPTIQRTITQSPIQALGRAAAPMIQPAMRAITPSIRAISPAAASMPSILGRTLSQSPISVASTVASRFIGSLPQNAARAAALSPIGFAANRIAAINPGAALARLPAVQVASRIIGSPLATPIGAATSVASRLIGSSPTVNISSIVKADPIGSLRLNSIVPDFNAGISKALNQKNLTNTFIQMSPGGPLGGFGMAQRFLGDNRTDAQRRRDDLGKRLGSSGAPESLIAKNRDQVTAAQKSRAAADAYFTDMQKAGYVVGGRFNLNPDDPKSYEYYQNYTLLNERANADAAAANASAKDIEKNNASIGTLKLQYDAAQRAAARDDEYSQPLFGLLPRLASERDDAMRDAKLVQSITPDWKTDPRDAENLGVQFAHGIYSGIREHPRETVEFLAGAVVGGEAMAG